MLFPTMLFVPIQYDDNHGLEPKNRSSYLISFPKTSLFTLFQFLLMQPEFDLIIKHYTIWFQQLNSYKVILNEFHLLVNPVQRLSNRKLGLRATSVAGRQKKYFRLSQVLEHLVHRV